MKISVVKIGEKYAVRIKPFFDRVVFAAKTEDYTYNNPMHVVAYCLFDTEVEANARADILRAVK